MRGKFIVLEGIDGCGKTTQIKHLSNWLPASGLMPKEAHLQITREPGGTNLGLNLRKLLLENNRNHRPNPTTELLLYAADRAQHISEIIVPSLERGNWIISDRFSGSTFAYQGYGRNLNLEIISQLDFIATQGIRPDLTFLIKIPIEESLARRKVEDNDRMESEGADFLEKVGNGFNLLAEKYDWIPIEGNMQKEIVSIDIQRNLIEHFKK